VRSTRDGNIVQRRSENASATTLTTPTKEHLRGVEAELIKANGAQSGYRNLGFCQAKKNARRVVTSAMAYGAQTRFRTRRFDARSAPLPVVKADAGMNP